MFPDLSRFRHRLLPYAVRRVRGGIVLVAVLALAGWTGSWHWIPELFSHFFLQYALVLVLLAALSCLMRDGLWRWAALAALALAGCAVAPFWLPVEEAAQPLGMRLRLLQFNAAHHTEALTRWLAAHRQEVDVVLVLEAGPAFEADMQKLSGDFPYRIAQLDDSPFGIALLSRYPLHEARVLEIAGPDFPALQSDVTMNGGVVRLIGIHPPPPISDDLAQWRNRFMEALATRLDETRAPGRETLVFGDFNSTVWSPRLRDFMARTGLSDAQRGQGAPGTWPAIAARHSGLFGIPMDMTLVSGGIAVLKRRIGPDWGSDHLPALTEVAMGGSAESRADSCSYRSFPSSCASSRKAPTIDSQTARMRPRIQSKYHMAGSFSENH
jgi:endonuclease/exonuclease/phosphatase (EEP) superfamily protein YafD